MRVHFTDYGNIQAATADGTRTFEHQAGESVDLPADIAALFIQHGVAQPVRGAYKPGAIDGDGDGRVQDGTKFERPVGQKAVKSKGTTATKK